MDHPDQAGGGNSIDDMAGSDSEAARLSPDLGPPSASEVDKEAGRPEISEEDLRWAGVVSDDGVPTSSASTMRRLTAGSDATASGVATPFRGESAERRVAATRRALDAALDAWWRDGVVPDPSLLRDGLLLLNAGYELDSTQCALLLRSALHHRRGMLTALSHQTDAERTAVILHDALVDPDESFSDQDLEQILKEDARAEVWAPHLRDELAETALDIDPDRRRNATLALAVLDGSPAITAEDLPEVNRGSADLSEMLGNEQRRPPTLLVVVLTFLAILFVAAAAFQLVEKRRVAGMVPVPGGSFELANPDGTSRAVSLPSFLIDATETTVRDFNRCVRSGACRPPVANHSATRDRYFDDPAFGDYPVLLVDHQAARAYCAWAGKRLPEMDEWQLAASWAPATQRTFRYPWGDRYVSGLANDASAPHRDTLNVGGYRPAGDSPLGLSDMAGNVAEWTATSVDPSADTYWVKGGSFLDSSDALRSAEGLARPASKAADWIGFRCATRSRWATLAEAVWASSASNSLE